MSVNGMDVTGHLKKGEVDLGTSIMAVAYDKGVIMGADSRTTMGSYIANRVTDKLTHLSDRIYCCRSGSAADTQALADIVTYYLDMYGTERGSPPQTHIAATLFQELVYQNKDRLSAGIIVAGWDKKNGGKVYNIPLGGGTFEQPWAIGGSGSTYIYGYCDATWKAGWGKQQTIEFVKNALSLAMRRDGSSGGTIRMVDITEDGVERHFIPGDQLPELADRIV
ncbi:proteasome-domain-containing protein [Testicularia cyperi]|uniref:Proteasome subunit beta n=1 Tax=Testicularia cyperi TaxID=1882483 RepID=A0A317XYA4_9BASI|nr:proteasome-domain-containing protein [Testicularia cyperi]